VLQGTFNSATAFNQPISSWNTARVTCIINLFSGATVFNQPLAWNVAAVTDMYGVFSKATAFSQSIAGRAGGGTLWLTYTICRSIALVLCALLH
jgi:surface protein